MQPTISRGVLLDYNYLSSPAVKVAVLTKEVTTKIR